MERPLHILHLEDDQQDVTLIQSLLESEGIECEVTCVQNRKDFVAALELGGIDLILSDFSLPAFDGLSALAIVRDRWPAIPLILVSGSLGEEAAVDALKSGATDYVLKERLSRLAPAVRRAIQEVKERMERRRTEEALKEAEQQLRTIFSGSVMGIALVGADGCPVLTNTALQKMLGYTGDELNRMPFVKFTHPDDCDKDVKLFQELIHGTRNSYQIEKRYLHKGGRAIWTRLSVSASYKTAHRAEFAIAMVEDITERLTLEAQFIEAQKMEVVGQLASGVAHDFNNILAVIMGYSDLIQAGLEANNPLRDYNDQIRHAAERAVGVTRQLLVFSRKQTVQAVVLDLNNAVKELGQMLRRLIDENIEMTLVPGKQIGRIKADSGYVGQVLMNLVVNARDAMPNGGKLVIATSDVTLGEDSARAVPGAIPGNYVMLSVSDTGTGMTEQVKGRLFEAFFTTKVLGKGTGLGLATCQTIVQQSGGYIGVSSELGKGSIFKIFFPRVELPLDVTTGSAPTGPIPRGTETLLMVEDEPSVRHLACGFLKTQGYEVLSASNGQDALHVARDHKGAPIRLVVTDVIMPLMGGKVMAEWLKTTYPDLKILFTSGYTNDTTLQQGMHEPGIDFLSKPYTPATLAIKVRRMLDGTGDTSFLQKSEGLREPNPVLPK